MSSYEIKHGQLCYTFAGNGMLQGIFMPEEFGSVNLIRETSTLVLSYVDGRVFFPEAGKIAPVRWKSRNGAEMFEFANLPFADSEGKIEPGLRLTLRYELFSDGTAFVDAFFLGEQEKRESINRFELTIPLDFSSFETKRWSLTYRPKKIDGALIQTSTPDRNMLPGVEQIMEHSIFPLAGFNLWQKQGPSCYAEFVMESDNVLSGNPANNRSAVTWKDENPTLSWNFQTAPEPPRFGPWQWRNRWGWVIAPAAQTRHYPPFQMYHFFDNINRYPEDEALEAMAKSGADVLILHENWRTDAQNGGQPYDEEKFRHVIDFAHSRNIRVMVYIRGNEDSVVEEYADWFDKYFIRNYDGLYMDYGGPFHNQTPPDESAQGGRLHFRKHYLANRRLREIVGNDGLFFSHTGPMFSALGMTGGCIDGYVSGEGERGLLIRSRLDHAYFSMASVCAGTMWTAAFPEYSSPVMIPYLASAGQSAHLPLGVQFPSSSLAHPPVPGIGDVNFRPLWKLWHLMRGEKDLRLFNDYNCRDVFHFSENVTRYLMVSEKRAVCIFANISGETVEVDPFVNCAKAGISADLKTKICQPDVSSPGKAADFDGRNFDLPPYGVAAVVWGEADFEAYELPYPELSPLGIKYQNYVEAQRSFRAGKEASENWYIRISVKDLPVPYEYSMTVDLYDNRFEFHEIIDGKYNKLGYFAKDGFRKDPPEQKDFVMAGEESVWIPLKQLLGKGKKHLAIRSMHRGDRYYVNLPFYSFIELEVARTPGKAEYRLFFLNELEDDRSYLHFDLDFK